MQAETNDPKQRRTQKRSQKQHSKVMASGGETRMASEIATEFEVNTVMQHRYGHAVTLCV